jgi:Immunoglobulin domain
MKRIVLLCAGLGVATVLTFRLSAVNNPVCHPPSITNQPAGQTRYQYQNVTFAVTVDPASTTAPWSYQWRTNAVNLVDTDNRISGATLATLTIFDLTTNDAGAYYVVVSNSCVNGITNSANATLTVIAVDPTNATALLQGQSYPLKGTIPDSGQINLQVFTPLR